MIDEKLIAKCLKQLRDKKQLSVTVYNSKLKSASPIHSVQSADSEAVTLVNETSSTSTIYQPGYDEMYAAGSVLQAVITEQAQNPDADLLQSEVIVSQLQQMYASINDSFYSQLNAILTSAGYDPVPELQSEQTTDASESGAPTDEIQSVFDSISSEAQLSVVTTLVSQMPTADNPYLCCIIKSIMNMYAMTKAIFSSGQNKASVYNNEIQRLQNAMYEFQKKGDIKSVQNLLQQQKQSILQFKNNFLKPIENGVRQTLNLTSVVKDFKSLYASGVLVPSLIGSIAAIVSGQILRGVEIWLMDMLVSLKKRLGATPRSLDYWQKQKDLVDLLTSEFKFFGESVSKMSSVMQQNVAAYNQLFMDIESTLAKKIISMAFPFLDADDTKLDLSGLLSILQKTQSQKISIIRTLTSLAVSDPRVYILRRQQAFWQNLAFVILLPQALPDPAETQKMQKQVAQTHLQNGSASLEDLQAYLARNGKFRYLSKMKLNEREYILKKLLTQNAGEIASFLSSSASGTDPISSLQDALHDVIYQNLIYDAYVTVVVQHIQGMDYQELKQAVDEIGTLTGGMQSTETRTIEKTIQKFIKLQITEEHVGTMLGLYQSVLYGQLEGFMSTSYQPRQHIELKCGYGLLSPTEWLEFFNEMPRFWSQFAGAVLDQFIQLVQYSFEMLIAEQERQVLSQLITFRMKLYRVDITSWIDALLQLINSLIDYINKLNGNVFTAFLNSCFEENKCVSEEVAVQDAKDENALSAWESLKQTAASQLDQMITDVKSGASPLIQIPKYVWNIMNNAMKLMNPWTLIKTLTSNRLSEGGVSYGSKGLVQTTDEREQ